MRQAALWLATFGIAASATAIYSPAGVQLKGDRAKVDATRSELLTLKACLDQFRKECGRYPTTAEGLSALYKKPSRSIKGWTGPYISRLVTTDPWANDYRYIARRKGFQLISLGADGKLGGTGFNADLMVKR